MNFKFALDRLTEAAKGQRGMGNKASVELKDLRLLLEDYHRIDSSIRSVALQRSELHERLQVADNCVLKQLQNIAAKQLEIKRLQTIIYEAQEQDAVGEFNGKFEFGGGRNSFSVTCFDALPAVGEKLYTRPIPANKAGTGLYSNDPLACSGCASGCFRCRIGDDKLNTLFANLPPFRATHIRNDDGTLLMKLPVEKVEYTDEFGERHGDTEAQQIESEQQQ